jgi:hypothetical protein
MKYYKKLIAISFTLILCIFGVANVEAKEEVVFTSSNGVELTAKEYSFLVNAYNKDFPKNMTQEEYDFFKKGNYFDSTIEKKTYTENNSKIKQGTYYSTASKSIQITKAYSSSNCAITITATWFGDPSIKSYDLIGAYLQNVSRVGSVLTRSYSTTSSTAPSYTKTTANGVGASIRVPTAGSNISLYQAFTTTKGGTVYASYQHALANTTLAVSKQYNFSIIGYGNVFSFYGSAAGLYDRMNGVNISV